MEFKPLNIRGMKIKFPIIQGGMGLGISWDELAGNVAKEGGLGIISSIGTGYYQDFKFVKTKDERPSESSNFYSREALFEIFKNARKICGDAPLGANVLYAINDYGRVVQDSCEAGADMIITGAGLPINLPEFTKDYPKVALIPIVSSARALTIICKKWQKKYDRLPDAVIVEGPLSGGHQGFSYDECFKEENQLENIVPQVVEEAKKWSDDMPVIAAGGVWDHDDIKKFISLGASGVQMASRFLGTFECDGKIYHKILPGLKEDDIGLVKSPVGYPARAIKSKGIITKLSSIKIKCNSNCVSPCKRGVEARAVGYCIADRLGDSKLGNESDGLHFVGANAHRIDKIISVKELFKKLIHGEDS